MPIACQQITVDKKQYNQVELLAKEKGSDGKIINAVQQKMMDKQATVEVVNETGGKTLSQQAKDRLSKEQDMYVFIDSGGWLVDEKNMKSYAQGLLEQCKFSKPEIEGIVYHNAFGNIVCLEKGSTGEFVEVPINQAKYKTTDGKYLTIIAQKYETGTNILQPPTAKSIVSIRKGMTLRAILQSVFRMRGILLGQSASFLISEDVKKDIVTTLFHELLTIPSFSQYFESKEKFQQGLQEEEGFPPIFKEALKIAFTACNDTATKLFEGKLSKEMFLNEFIKQCTSHLLIGFEAIWRYVTVNQAHREQQKNWIAGVQRMRQVLEKQIQDYLTDTKVEMPAKQALFDKVQSFLVQATELDIAKQLSQGLSYISKEEAKQREIKKIRAVFNACPEDFKNRVEERKLNENLEKCIDLNDVPDLIFATGLDEGEIEQEEEKEVEEEQEIEEEKEIEEEQEIEHELRIEQDIKREDIGYNHLDKAEEAYCVIDKIIGQKTVNSMISCLSAIEYSPNLFVQWGEKEYYLPVRYVLAIQNNDGSFRWMGVSHEDAARIKLGMSNTTKNAFLLSEDGSVVASHNLHNIPVPKEECKDVFVQLKICAAQVLTESEVDRIKKIIDNFSSNEKPKKVKEIAAYYEKMMKYFPEQLHQYPGSALEKFFEEYKSIERPLLIQKFVSAKNSEERKELLPKVFSRSQEHNLDTGHIGQIKEYIAFFFGKGLAQVKVSNTAFKELCEYVIKELRIAAVQAYSEAVQSPFGVDPCCDRQIIEVLNIMGPSVKVDFFIHLIEEEGLSKIGKTYIGDFAIHENPLYNFSEHFLKATNTLDLVSRYVDLDFSSKAGGEQEKIQKEIIHLWYTWRDNQRKLGKA